MADLEICYLSAEELGSRFRSRELSPVEVVRNALARLDEVDSKLNGFVARCDERALAEAALAEERFRKGDGLGSLDGVPISVKDLIEVEGMPCAYGSRTMAGYVPPEDAPSVARLRLMGGIVIGKTATSEFGYKGYTSSLVHGETRNPWNLERTPGGSSGGASATVAAGVTPIALGTDGGGSIRTPAAFTGLVGLKPQAGRVPVWPTSATPTLAHVGPITRTVADAGLALSAMAGPDLRDHMSLLPRLEETAEDISRLRVAFSPTLGYAEVDPEVAEIARKAVEELRVLCEIDLLEAPFPDPAEILATEFIGGCSARLDEHVESSPELIDPPLLAAIKSFRARSAGDFARTLAARHEHRLRMERLFQDIDVLLTPATPTPAWPLGTSVPPGLEHAKVWSFFTYPFNLSGQPAGTVPCGMTGRGLPIGLQLVVPQLREDRLLAAMTAAEQTLGCGNERPPI